MWTRPWWQVSSFQLLTSVEVWSCMFQASLYLPDEMEEAAQSLGLNKIITITWSVIC